MGTINPAWTYAIWFSFAVVALGIFINYLRQAEFRYSSLRFQIALGLAIITASMCIRSGAIWLFLLEQRSELVSWHWMATVAMWSVLVSTVGKIVGLFLVIRAMSHEQCGERGWLLAACLGGVIAIVASALT